MPRAAPAPLAPALVPLASFGSFGTGPSQFKFPARVVTTTNLVFVLDRGNNRIMHLALDGSLLGVTTGVVGGVLRDVKLAYNGLTPFPARAKKIEAVLEGRRPEDVTAEALDDAIAQSFTARDGLRATWAYRALVARNLVLRFVQPDLQPSLSTQAEEA